MSRFGRKKKPHARTQPQPRPSLHMIHEPKTVVVCSPMMDMCHTIFATSLVHLVAHTMTHADAGSMQVSFLQYGTSILPLSRELLAVKAIEAGATHLLWIDSDMEFPADMLLRFARHDAPIVAANCMSRRPPYHLTARDEANMQVFTRAESHGLEKVARVGFGVTWVAAEVFKAMPRPWFDLEYLPDKGIHRGEDFYFCEKARAAGFDIHIDHDVSKDVRHVGLFGYSPLLKREGEEG